MSELVGLNVQTPDFAGKLSQLLSIRQQQQALRAQTAEASGAVQTQQQRAGIANYMKAKLGTHVGEDGTIDTDAIANDPDFLGAAGDKAPEVLSNLVTVKNQQLEAKQKFFDLTETQRKGLAEVLAPSMNDPEITGISPDDPQAEEKNQKAKQRLNADLESWYAAHGKSVLPVIAAYAPALKNAPPGALQNVVRTMVLGAQDVSKQKEIQTPTLVNRGDALVNQNPLVKSPDIPLGLPPGVYTDANGAQFRIDNNGRRVNPLGSGGAPGPTSAPTQEPRKFVQPVPGQDELVKHVEQTRKADSDYGQNRHVNEEILRLSEDTATGPGTAAWHTGTLGKIPGIFGSNAAADYQKISAYLDRQAAMATQQMGLPETNAGLQTAANLSGTTEYTPGALQTKVKLTDAMVEGAHQYRQGLDKVIGTGPNQDLSRLNEFRNQWSANFDPNVFRAENALKRGDKKELAAIREEVGSRGMAELKAKSDNLRKLEAGELLK